MPNDQQQKKKELMVVKKKKQRPPPLTSNTTIPLVDSPPAVIAGGPSSAHLQASSSGLHSYHGFHVPPPIFAPHPHPQSVIPSPQFNRSDSGPSVPLSHPSPQVGSTGSQEEAVSHMGIGRTVLSLEGQGFVSSHCAASAITVLIRGHYRDGWPSWGKIPPEVVDMWFKEFVARFSFSPPDIIWAKANFEYRGSCVLKNNLNKIRKSGKQPGWIGDAAWETLQQHWRSDAFKKQSETAKKNRSSDCGGFGGSLHTCGSITTSQHRANLTKLNGAAPSPATLFRHTHQRKKDSSWVDRRSETIFDDFNRSMEEMTQRASDQGSSLPNELDVWRETAGVKKGRIYGLGLESTTINSGSSAGSSSTDWVSRETIDEMLKRKDEEWSKKFEELEAERDAIRTERNQMQSKFEAYEAQFQKIMTAFSLQQSQAKDKGKVTEDEEAGEDDSDEEVGRDD